jgi:CHAT domain-containing protein
LAVTSDASALYRLPAQKVIQEKVDAYFKIVGQAPTSLSPIPAGKQLFDMLLAPAGELLNSVKDLIIVPDGGLYVLAFETLAVEAHPNRTHYLVESYNVRYAPSASVLAMIKGRRLKAPLKHNMDLLAFADPIFNKDESDVLYRGSALERRLDLRRLPNTAMEVERIAGLFPQDSRKVYLREAAKEGIVKSEALTDYRYLHFATHGIFDETLPERSGIVLTLEDDPAEDGILQVQEIFNLKVDAEMVVLSACQTGRGKYMRGEGLLGLTGAFFSAGADALVVSLWRVSDASTADFMASFYDYIQQGKSKPQALRQAKLDFLKSTVAAKRHPFFWAPFVLVGMSESSNL